MLAATTPPSDARKTRMLVVDAPSGALTLDTIDVLSSELHCGDLLVVNDSATLPASLFGLLEGCDRLEVRLGGQLPDGSFVAVLFGAGDWRQKTEDRPPPPTVRTGQHLVFGDLSASIVDIDDESPRLVRLRFDAEGSALWQALYRVGRPIQYSYHEGALQVWDVQTPFAGRPWAVEPPSAALALRWHLVLALRRCGVEIARVTHAAGLSSTGDDRLDARLPLAERYEVPAETVRAVDAARARGGRVIAAGTTVVRALESSVRGGELVAGSGWTELRLNESSTLNVCDGLLTGIHDAGTSHFELLKAFAGRDLLGRANDAAEEAGFRGHEFGDLMLILGSPAPSKRVVSADPRRGSGRTVPRPSRLPPRRP